MQAQTMNVAVCPECGTRREGAFSRGLGRCMICLLRVGFDDAEEPDETLFAPITDRLGNYRIERRDDETAWELGRGAMGITYRATDTSLQRPVALKLIASEWVKRGAEARERFMREARTAAALRHPNVATVYHFGIREENGQCFCAMELVEGETLETRVRRTGPLDALSTIEIALQVSGALAAAEKQGLVHRDLKPANLMVVEAASPPLSSRKNPRTASDLLVKIIDFGVAKALVEKPDAMGLTHGGFVGTPAFASPEQFTDARVDVRSDIYSLGVTLWYLLTGNRPFQGTTIEQIRSSQRSRLLPVEQLKAAHVPSRFTSLLVSMLASEPAARPDVRAVTSQLQDCRAHILDRWKSARRLAIAAGLIGIALAAVLIFPQKRNQPLSSATNSFSLPPKSIAVLPFRNLSENKENAFFADGIQDDLVTSMARIKDLKVVSRGSVASYRDLSGRRLRAIGQELGVGAILEGSVRRTANRVLVNVQLTDAMTERQIWSDRYDRTLKDSIALQGEVAAEIATALAAKLSPEEKAQVEAKLTNNPDAYVVYLRGREFQMRPEVSRDNYLAAEQRYRHAVALDPRFALAHARLAETLEGRSEYFDHQPALLAEARSHAEEALRLDPHCGQAHLVMAFILGQSVKSIERDKAIKEEVDSALRLVPNDGYLIMVAALFQVDMDWLEEAEETFKRAIEINPREPKVFYNYAYMLTTKGDVAKARWASDRSLELAPESVLFRLFRAIQEFRWTGEVARTKKFLSEIPPGKDPDGRVTAAHCTVAVYERNFLEALRLLAACPSERLPFLYGGFGPMVPKGFIEGMIHLYAGNKEHAYTAIDSARWILETEAQENPGDEEAHHYVAMAYAAMGWNDAALAENAGDTDGLSKAWLFARAGERDAALRQLEQLPTKEREYWYYELRLHPHWDPLRSDARFEKILAASAPKTATVPEKSIAILPFENRSEDKENAFLADGMQDDVLASLVQIKDLKVIGGSSVMSYRDAANRNLREIGQQLNVAHVLEGSVRRIANRMVVHVNLTDTRDGRSVWAERYDRTIADSTGLQGELAADIAGALQATLAPKEKARLQIRMTRNPEAYVHYLRGREYQMRPEVSRDNYSAAENFYKQAVALDPSFALARARLAEMQLWLYEKFETQPARIAEARGNAQDAVRWDPDCGQAHMALAGCIKANYLTQGKHEAGDGPAAMRREVADAVRLLPNDGYIALAAAMLQWDMEWNDEAAASFERAMVLNPREGKAFYNYGALLVEKDIPRSRWASDRALELSPDSIFFRLNRASWEIDWTGEVDRASAILAGLPAGKDPDGRVTAAYCTIALFERDFPEALRLLAACKYERVPFLDGSFGLGSFVPKGFVEGLVHFWAGNLQEAYARLDSARWMLEDEAQESAAQAEAHWHLALAYAAMGWSDAAKAEILHSYKKPDVFQVASVFTLLGDHDSALPLIEQGISAWRAARTHLRLHPLWDSLRTDPRFQKLLAQNAGTGD
jgi:TolB-like protein/Tfp pilus assembly protein PilF